MVGFILWCGVLSLRWQGTNPALSWLLGEQRALASTLVVATAFFFAIAAVGLVLQTSWWDLATLIAAGASLIVVALFPSAIAKCGSLRRLLSTSGCLPASSGVRGRAAPRWLVEVAD